MIAFSCNVPQIALTFGKYSTSGPIQLQTFFLEEERNGREGGSDGLLCSERGCFLAQMPGADPWPLLPETQAIDCPFCICLWTGGWGGGTEVPTAETRFQITQHVFTEALPGVLLSTVTWRYLPAINGAPTKAPGHVLSTLHT